ncbi:MAG: ammonium transporter, partial [Chloroflexia bacterium]|nr:ammonium transporter [Chloroflexia bacterium]
VWSGAGWLTDLGFTDFAGSTVVHSVGGWAALMGAIVLGARIGRFSKDGKSQPIPGHNVSLVGLGVFILWLGWFGFNPGSQLALSSQADANAVALVAVNTTLAAAAAAVATVILTWIRTGKPDAGLTLNSVIGGLVAITAACAFVTPVGAVIIGLVAGPLLVFSTSWLESLKIDDPVGAVPAHLVNGVWGTLALGLFAAIEGNTGTLGLFYGGGMALLIAQAIGVVAVGVWTVVLSGALFYGIKATIGLRVSKEEEELGLDLGEHGMAAYPDFIPTPTPGMAPPAPPSGGVSRAPAK